MNVPAGIALAHQMPKPRDLVAGSTKTSRPASGPLAVTTRFACAAADRKRAGVS